MNNNKYLISLVRELCKTGESEWVEFKQNNSKKDEIGRYISALSNSATLSRKSSAYLIWGVDDSNHSITGTNFNPFTMKVGNEELESWLLQRLTPKLHFRFNEVILEEKRVIILEIPAAYKSPTTFENEASIRIGSSLRKLINYSEKERELWSVLGKTPFEILPAIKGISESDVLPILDHVSCFDLLNKPLPDGRQAILEALESEELIYRNDAGFYNITNLGAILFAKDLKQFKTLERKAIRVIQYAKDDRTTAQREEIVSKGYAAGFQGLIEFIKTLVPSQENMESPIRKTETLYPILAIRELVANAMIHQDFTESGNSVMIEIFKSRIEISNPGKPLIPTLRFLDSPPKSRNEKLASLMRRMGICEERGSGIDKVIIEVELNQLPAPIIEDGEGFTRVCLFSHRELRNLTKQDRIRACYYHAAVKYITHDYMTNTSIRERFGIASKHNSAMASRIIKDALEDGVIYIYDESVGAKARKYIPKWAKQTNV